MSNVSDFLARISGNGKKGEMYKQYVTLLADELATEGARIIKECEQEREYTHRTRNLVDSYGFAVYHDGAVIRKGFITSQPQASTTKKWHGKDYSGRSTINDFFLHRHKEPNGMSLVIAAAMPYAEELETGKGIRRRYKVISMAFDKLAAIKPQDCAVKMFNERIYS